ncbi:hypothetical protein M3P05_17510 [Sansalvadorimonas sp. 2012CJ34-2]|uniref:Uncharacterized protein n=1 Tax=Parendozoicomonas callyspongiae TaxID=2942213 RepID=A0ABT0PK03_9GAMM|nr:hypothetical protein [Sansalvadorimonas sp. 2012CJ34-2]MCL6271719.1 hypothetical protein [Sansalvadorimonas sp. 2012CJ34-2]
MKKIAIITVFYAMLAASISLAGDAEPLSCRPYLTASGPPPAVDHEPKNQKELNDKVRGIIVNNQLNSFCRSFMKIKFFHLTDYYFEAYEHYLDDQLEYAKKTLQQKISNAMNELYKEYQTAGKFRYPYSKQLISMTNGKSLSWLLDKSFSHYFGRSFSKKHTGLSRRVLNQFSLSQSNTSVTGVTVARKNANFDSLYKTEELAVKVVVAFYQCNNGNGCNSSVSGTKYRTPSALFNEKMEAAKGRNIFEKIQNGLRQTLAEIKETTRIKEHTEF